MTNDLKNFLEGEHKYFWDKVHFALPTDFKDQEETIGVVSDENLSKHNAFLINFVLDLVEKRLPEIEKRKENVLFSSNIQDHLDDAITAGKERYRHETLTIINNLKV